ncbi:DUF4129 domain-containing protein [Haloarchaeobius sp. TZWWS8]|uniref:DUF4129 domain-containing protein n=1 Tax=Haloarchaeobius sp. TZWWS8 TaxID=3446121 RepID=UPI003EC06284
MKRTAVVPLALAAICIVAIAFTAASIVEPEASGGGSSVFSPTDETASDESGEAGTSAADPIFEPAEPFTFSFVCVPFLLSGEFAAVALLLVAGVWLYVQRTTDAVAATGLVAAVGLPAFLFWLLLTSCPAPDQSQSSSLVPTPEFPDPRGDDASLGIADAAGQLDPTLPLLVVAIVVVAVVFALAYLVWQGDRDDDGDQPEPELEEAPPDDAQQRLAAIGTAAGRAADRLTASTDVDNEVYRAWREMTSHLDVADPSTSTPAEFASAAVDAGMDETHVTELTDLFERVRYGGAPVTAEREARATAALRAIESAYAPADAGENR